MVKTETIRSHLGFDSVEKCTKLSAKKAEHSLARASTKQTSLQLQPEPAPK